MPMQRNPDGTFREVEFIPEHQVDKYLADFRLAQAKADEQLYFASLLTEEVRLNRDYYLSVNDPVSAEYYQRLYTRMTETLKNTKSVVVSTEDIT